MSSVTTAVEEDGAGTTTLQVNTIALIAGISVVATILVIVCVVALIFWCRNLSRRRKRDRSRSRLYMVHEGASPFSSMNGPPSGGVPSFNGNVPSNSHSWCSSYFQPSGYENKGADMGEFRRNPLAEHAYYPRPMNSGLSMLNIPPNYNNDLRRYNDPRLAQSAQSLGYETQPFYHSLYSKLVDTIHVHNGKPLYLCKREDYFGMLSDYFDIIGKTRTGDWLVRPKANVPNRPKRVSKKNKAPKPGNAHNNKNGHFSSDHNRLNGYIMRPGGGSGVIATPFGAAERMHTRYLAGSNSDGGENKNVEPGYASLPRDGKLHGGSNLNFNKVKRQASVGSSDRELSFQRHQRQQRIDEEIYSKVMQKNALNGGIPQSSNIPERQNPSRRPISTIEESPKVAAKTAATTNKAELLQPESQHRERSGSASTIKSLGAGITDQFKFLEQYDTEEERF